MARSYPSRFMLTSIIRLGLTPSSLLMPPVSIFHSENNRDNVFKNIVLPVQPSARRKVGNLSGRKLLGCIETAVTAALGGTGWFRAARGLKLRPTPPLMYSCRVCHVNKLGRLSLVLTTIASLTSFFLSLSLYLSLSLSLSLSLPPSLSRPSGKAAKQAVPIVGHQPSRFEQMLNYRRRICLDRPTKKLVATT